MNDLSYYSTAQKRLMFFRYFVFILCYLGLAYTWFSIHEAYEILRYAVAPFAFAFAGTFLFQEKPLPTYIKLAIAFPLWYFITRIVNGDYSLAQSFQNFIGYFIAYCISFPFVYLLPMKKRRNCLIAFSMVYLILLAIMSWISVFACIRQEPFTIPHFTNYIIGLNEFYINPTRLNVMNQHPNFVGAFLVMGFGVTMYIEVTLKKKWIIAPLVLIQLGIYLAVALTVSRTSMIEIALLMAVGVVILFLRKPSRLSRVSKSAITIALASCIAFVAYIGFDASIALMSSISEKLQPQTSTVIQSNITTNLELPFLNHASANTDSIVDKREISEHIGTLTGRTDIFLSAIPAIRANPKALFVGTLEDGMMKVTEQVIGRAATHYHNSWLHTLMLTGMPGLAVIIVLTFFILRATFTLCFKIKIPINISDIFLCLIPIALLFHSLFESFAFINYTLLNMVFSFYAGAVLQRAKDVKISSL